MPRGHAVVPEEIRPRNGPQTDDFPNGADYAEFMRKMMYGPIGVALAGLGLAATTTGTWDVIGWVIVGLGLIGVIVEASGPASRGEGEITLAPRRQNTSGDGNSRVAIQGDRNTVNLGAERQATEAEIPL